MHLIFLQHLKCPPLSLGGMKYPPTLLQKIQFLGGVSIYQMGNNKKAKQNKTWLYSVSRDTNHQVVRGHAVYGYSTRKTPMIVEYSIQWWSWNRELIFVVYSIHSLFWKQMACCINIMACCVIDIIYRNYPYQMVSNDLATLIYILCVCVWADYVMVHVWRSENNLMESVLPSNRWDSELRLPGSGKWFYLLTILQTLSHRTTLVSSVLGLLKGIKS